VATDLNIRKDIKDYLVLSTIHQAKGLEWDAVFIIGVMDGELPDYRNVYDAHLLDEELRLLYVACTRAKRFLFLSYPREDTRNTFTKIFSISRFLEKLPPNLYEKEEE
jgi:DNA helicase-2/ATP-dependent DNA helicase PcrA